jgi:N-acetylneuraminic acid mutarotase
MMEREIKKLSRLGVLFKVIFLFLFSANSIAAEWQTKSEMPSARQEIYADVADGVIYVAGGILNDIVTTSTAFEAFNARQNSWSKLKPLPVPRHHITPAIIGDKVYAMGGFDGPYPEWAMKADMFVYNIASDSWEQGKALPEPVGEHVAIAFNNKIHVIGGRVRSESGKNHFDAYIDSKAHYIYNPEQNEWSTGTAAPTARNSAAAAVIDGLIYVVGGRRNVMQKDGTQLQQNLSNLEVYNPETNEWHSRAPLPESLGGNAAASVDGKLYVFGGEQWSPEHKVFPSSWAYDPATDKWQKVKDMLTARHGLAAAAVDDVIYTIGGCTRVGGGATVGATEALILINEK